MPKAKSSIIFGERGGAYRLRPGHGEESGKRAYLSKDGKRKEMELVEDILKEGGSSLIADPHGAVQQNLVHRNEYGGVAPPGYGEHPQEMGYWETPNFRIHPLPQILEAINGLFFRLWPEHVRILQKMKMEGWPHVEIVVVSKEFRRRQDEQFQRDEQMAQQHLAMAQEEEAREAGEVHGFRPEEAAEGGMPPEGAPPPEGMPPPEGALPGGMPPEMAAGPPAGAPLMAPPGMPPGMPPGAAPPMMRSLSLSQGDDYFDKLEEFRGKFYTRDGFDSLRRARNREKSPAPENVGTLMKRNGSSNGDEDRGGFGIIIKATFDFEDKTTLDDRRRSSERGFTTREHGILNGPPTADVEKEDELAEEEEGL
jgi:hypothetical protein